MRGYFSSKRESLMPDTIAAVATGNQIAAIGIVRMSGEKSIEIADRLFHPYTGGHLKEAKDRKLVFGELRGVQGELLDICMCTVSRGPQSYTGEDTAEFQCHGSPMLLRYVLQELFSLGARQAGPGEFTKRAFLNGKMDLSSAEAVIDLIDAETADAVKNAAGQLSGAIHRKAEAVYQAIEGSINHKWTVTALQTHPAGIIVCDKEATKKLSPQTIEYFKSIESVA